MKRAELLKKSAFLIVLLVFIIAIILTIIMPFIETNYKLALSPPAIELRGDAISDVLDRIFPWRNRPCWNQPYHPDEVVCAKFQSVLETDCATLTTTCLMCGGDGSQSGESCGELWSRFGAYRDQILATACDECYPERFNEIRTCCSRMGG